VCHFVGLSAAAASYGPYSPNPPELHGFSPSKIILVNFFEYFWMGVNLEMFSAIVQKANLLGIHCLKPIDDHKQCPCQKTPFIKILRRYLIYKKKKNNQNNVIIPLLKFM
jgi:hypothetical protein